MKSFFGVGSENENRKQISSPTADDDESSNGSDHGEGSDSRNNSISSAGEESTFHDSYQYLESDFEDFYSVYEGPSVCSSPSYQKISDSNRTTSANVICSTNGESLPIEVKQPAECFLEEQAEPLGSNRKSEDENLKANDNKVILNGEVAADNASNHSSGTVHAIKVDSGSNFSEVPDGDTKRSCCLPICSLSFKLRRKHKRNSTQ